MPLKTLKQLRQGARDKTDLTQDSDAVSDSTLNNFINQAWHELYDLIIDADDARLFAKNAGVMSQVGEHAYRLPDDMYRLVGCHVSNGQWYAFAIRADSSRYAELTRLANQGSYVFKRPEYYYRWDPNTGERDLFVFPRDIGEVAVVYFPQPKVLEDDDDYLDNPSSWLEFVEAAAGVRMLDKLERDASRLAYQKKILGQKIEDAVNDMDFHSPPKVRDTEGNYDKSWGRFFS